MKLLLSHNYYRHHGGEEQVLLAESNLLLRRGHSVVRYERDSADIPAFSLAEYLALPVNAIWARQSYREVRDLIRRERPDVAHFHNVFPLISPSAYHACKDAGVPVVQTLHNYRLLCPATTLLRNGQICEACMGRKVALPGIAYGCYHDSRLRTLVMAGALTTHHLLKTWDEVIDRYIALTEFGRMKFIEGGLNPEKIAVKPNFMNDVPEIREGDGTYALFAGRVVGPKGVITLLQAWKDLVDIPLKITGEGPLLDVIRASIAPESGIEILGRRRHERVLTLMQGARFLIFPSEWYEGLPMTILEAFACGLPVLASGIGAMAEIVEDGVTGLHFEPGDPKDLAAKIQWAWSHPGEMTRMGQHARRTYEAKYTADRNYDMLMKIYSEAIELASGH